MAHYGICNLSVIPLRAEPSDKSEILSQLIFGDAFEILEYSEKWVNIKTKFDDYTGWIDPKQLTLVDEHFYFTSNIAGVLGCAVAHQVRKVASGEILYLPSGSSIPSLASNGTFNLGNDQYEFKEQPNLVDLHDFEKQMESFSRFFLQAPYLWGGRTLAGIDCSGFTQIVYKMLGISLKRDAWQQAEQGETVHFLQEVKKGDLAFFDNDEGRITHVGIMLNECEIIHASGRVKIDPIDDQGIYSLDLKKHTHKLRIIKRMQGLN